MTYDRPANPIREILFDYTSIAKNYAKMTLDQLRYALEVQKYKNFSRAAEASSITQPSLSVQISKLEDELGVPLFVRSRSGVEATEYGEQLLKQARLVLEEAGRMGQLASDLKGEVQGTFRLGIIPTLATSLLPLILRGFGERYPRVNLEIVEEPTERLVKAIDEGALDGAILSTPAKCPEEILEKVLFYEPFVVFASTGHPLLQGKQVNASQIDPREILLLDETHCMRDQVLQLCKAKTTAISRRFRIQSGSLHTLIELIRREKGYTLLPSLALRFLTSVEQSKNVRTFGRPAPARKISLVFHKSRLKRSIIEALHDEILAQTPAEGAFKEQTRWNAYSFTIR